MANERDLQRDTVEPLRRESRDPETVGRRSASAGLKASGAPQASGLIHRKRDANGVAQGADAAVGAASSSQGSSLPVALQRKFEASLATDLSSVRVHTGSASATAAKAVGARAYTTGQDIHFASGAFDPSSSAGEHLLAHEVAHTVQQRGSSAVRQHKLEVSSPHDAAEIEADRAADAMVAGHATQISATPSQVSRGEDDACREEDLPIPQVCPTDTPAKEPVCPVEAEEFNWEQAANGAIADGEITAPWSGGPSFGAACSPDQEAGIQAFAAVWGEVQGDWNNAVPLFKSFSDAKANAEELGLIGMPDASKNKSAGVLDPDSVQPGDMDHAVSKGRPRGSQSKMSIDDALNKAEGAMGKTRITPELEAAVADYNTKRSEAEDAEGDLRTSARGIATALSAAYRKVELAKMEKEKKDLEKGQAQTEREKAVAMGGLNSVKKSVSLFEKYAAARGGAKEGGGKMSADDSRRKVGEDGGITDALFAPVEFLVEQSYDDQIFQAQSAIASLENCASMLQLDEANEELAAAKEAAHGHSEDVAKLKRKVALAREARRLGLAKLADEFAKTAAENPDNKATPEEAEAIKIAIRAIPALDLIIAKLTGLTVAVGGLPGGSVESDRGAAMCTNRDALIAHYGTMLGAQSRLNVDLPYWQAQRDKVEELVRQHG